MSRPAPSRYSRFAQLLAGSLLVASCGSEPGAKPLLHQEISTQIQGWLAQQPEVQLKSSLFPLATESKLSQTLERHSKAMKLPGAVVAIAASQQTWVQATGSSDLDQQVALQPDDRFRLGNLSELFAAVVCLQLVEEESLSLKDPIANWLPTEISRSIPDAKKITVRQLLNHTSALPDLDVAAFEQAVKADPSHRWTAAEMMPFMTQPASRARGGFTYSRLNYLLLELIIERAGGSSLAEAIQTRIVQPLDLKNTYVELSATKTIAHGYQDWDGDGSREDVTQPLINTGLGLGNQAMISNAPDLIRFFQALFQQKKLLTPAAQQQMLTIVEMRKGGYGLGILNSLTRWGETWGQTDADATGFSSAVVYLPVHDLIVVAWTNTANAESQPISLIDASLEIVLGNLSKIPASATTQW
ncbi:MAG: beta-lactamase family protein [Pegethrix bostrychoides GSE-TBD4-15B]|uniref:Beta-lactamase family protein n=1 Tax=Pegethrix bostrychoides GSE-TBD4-15B TaxID=2839662 RepID=A0A951P818_9CYAN|nr:beta-lactamase family protein [Pegethrix bostrychoides GSE-TBD4-15B]